jgi:hypothetical protein
MARLHERLLKLESRSTEGIPPLIFRMGSPVTRFVHPASLGWTGEPDPGPLLRQPGETDAEFSARGLAWGDGLEARVIIGYGE